PHARSSPGHFAAVGLHRRRLRASASASRIKSNPVLRRLVHRPDRSRLLWSGDLWQVGIVRQLPNGHAVVASVKRGLAAAREAGFRVFFLRHMSLPLDVAGVMQLRMGMAWRQVQRIEDLRPWFLRDSPGFAITDELAPRPSEAIFDKIGF